ncbi:M28 family peptidase [Streptomyces sp. NBC_00024]|uniref:M28 family peptidase n=1 Tax=Streptomyces sp. NBC_00024 TaxID=2903612 RepID=UPI00325409D0
MAVKWFEPPALRRRTPRPAPAAAGDGRTTAPRPWWPLSATLVLALLCLALAAWDSRMPGPRGPDAPAGTFSAARATAHVRAIAQEPRPHGSAAQSRARDHLVRTLTGLGIDTRVHTGAAAAHMPDLSPTGADSRYASLRLDNIVARIPGTDSTRPVALVTHYDSVEAGPGANDAGVPVSVLLETARALRSGPPPRNDVLFILTDAEESGLLGAQALVNSPDVLPRDAVVLNFEARGSKGPSLMFETGPDAAWLVDALADHAPDPRTSSLLDAAYGYLPNLTDFTVFKRAGHQGLNLAYLDGYTHYHGPDDSPENVDPATVQHQGDQALALARGLGAADLAHTPRGDSVYFQVAGRLLSYPAAVALPTALAVTGLALALFLRLRARATVTVKGTARGLAVVLGQVLLACGAAFALAPLTASGHAEFSHYGDIPGHGPAVTGFLLLALALGTALALLTRRWAGRRDQVTGAIVLWLLLACATAAFLPGASHVFTWPALGLVAAALLTSRAGAATADRILAAVLGVLPLGLLVLPLVLLLPTALGLGLVAGPVVFVVLMSALLPAVLPPAPRPRLLPLVPATAAAVSAALLAATALFPVRDDHPGRADLLYFLDADRRRAHWLSGSPPDASSELLPQGAEPASVADLWPGWQVPVRRGPAAVRPLAAPKLTTTLVGDDGADGRRVRVTAASRRGARELVFLVTGAAVRGYTLTGVPGHHRDTPAGNPPWELWVRQVPDRGLRLELELAPGPGPVTVRVIDRTTGPPADPGDTPRSEPRPPALGVASFSEATMVMTARTLG